MKWFQIPYSALASLLDAAETTEEYSGIFDDWGDQEMIALMHHIGVVNSERVESLREEYPLFCFWHDVSEDIKWRPIRDKADAANRICFRLGVATNEEVQYFLIGVHGITYTNG